MAETFPRWNLTELELLTTDPAEIQARMITACEANLGRTLAQADPLRVYLNGFIAAIVQLRTLFNIGAQQNHLSYAQGKYLDAQGERDQIYRLDASPAVTTIRFKLAQALGNDYVIDTGTAVTNGIATFETAEELIIRSGELTGDVLAYCTEAGEIGNGFVAGQVNTIVCRSAFVESATNITTTAGGAEAESDEQYANRIRLTANTSVAGPRSSYKALTLSVSPAIVDVSVDTPTAGIVDIYPLLRGGELPTESMIQQIEDFLSADERRPLTDEVHVHAPTPVPFEIDVNYWISYKYKNQVENIRLCVEKAVYEYVEWQQGQIGRDIVPARMVSKMLDAGALRIDQPNMKPEQFIVVKPSEIAQCISVKVTYQGVSDE